MANNTLAVKAANVLQYVAKALLTVVESRSKRFITSKEDRSKLDADFSNRLSSVIKTAAALQNVGVKSSQIGTAGGGVSNIADYVGPSNLMRLISINRVYANSAAILRAKPLLEVVWDASDVPGDIMSATEFNLFWEDLNSLQDHRKLAMSKVEAQDITIDQFATIMVGGKFRRSDGQLDPVITALLGISVPGDPECYAPAIPPTAEEVELWLVSSGIVTKPEE